MKILQIKPKKILQWDFFALPPKPETSNSNIANPKTDSIKIKEGDLFLEPLKCIELKGEYYLLDGHQRWRYLEKENSYPFLVFESFLLEELWQKKLLYKWQNQKINLFELAKSIKNFAKFLKISEIELWYRLDFTSIFSRINFLKLALEMEERKPTLQKILPAEKWSLQTYKAFQFLSNKEIEYLQQKFMLVSFNANEWKKILNFLTALKRVKKVSFLKLLDLIETPAQLPEYSQQKKFEDWCKVLFALSNPITHQVQQQRKEKILNLELLPQIKLNYASDFEKKELNFYFQTKNSDELKKILLFLKNKVKSAESQIEDLYKII